MALPSPIQAFISSISYTYVLLCAELQMCLLHLFTKNTQTIVNRDYLYILASFNDQVYTYTFVKEKFRD